MKKIIIILGLIIICAVAVFSYQNPKEDVAEMYHHLEKARAEEKNKKLIVEDMYAFATAPNAKTGAVFMTLKNASNEPNSLIEARSSVAEIVEIHENLIDPDDGTMMMRKIKNIDINANDQTILEPTGYHVMLINLNQQLVKSETFPLTLIFTNGDEITQEVEIVAPGAKVGSNDEHDHSHKDHHNHDHEHDENHVHPPDYEPRVEEDRMDFSDIYLKAE